MNKADRRNHLRQGFTLMELMVVIVLISIIAMFAIPNYTKAIRKSHERDMVTQAKLVHAANKIYKAHSTAYWSTDGVPETDVSVINSNLGVNLISQDGMTYSYNSLDGSTFGLTITWDDFSVFINEGEISAGNPCCSAGTCPSLSAC